MKKIFTSAMFGVASGCTCGGLTIIGALTAPIFYPVAGAIGGYLVGRESGVAKGEIGPAAIGCACGIASVPLAPLSLLAVPVTSTLCALHVGIGTFLAMK